MPAPVRRAVIISAQFDWRIPFPAPPCMHEYRRDPANAPRQADVAGTVGVTGLEHRLICRPPPRSAIRRARRQRRSRRSAWLRPSTSLTILSPHRTNQRRRINCVAVNTSRRAVDCLEAFAGSGRVRSPAALKLPKPFRRFGNPR